MAVSDAATEANTGTIASELGTTNSTLSNILTQDTSTAKSDRLAAAQVLGRARRLSQFTGG